VQGNGRGKSVRHLRPAGELPIFNSPRQGVLTSRPSLVDFPSLANRSMRVERLAGAFFDNSAVDLFRFRPARDRDRHRQGAL
jgi:hypothetical protein